MEIKEEDKKTEEEKRINEAVDGVFYQFRLRREVPETIVVVNFYGEDAFVLTLEQRIGELAELAELSDGKIPVIRKEAIGYSITGQEHEINVLEYLKRFDSIKKREKFKDY